jgi:hypothetical protein
VNAGHFRFCGEGGGSTGFGDFFEGFTGATGIWCFLRGAFAKPSELYGPDGGIGSRAEGADLHPILGAKTHPVKGAEMPHHYKARVEEVSVEAVNW